MNMLAQRTSDKKKSYHGKNTSTQRLAKPWKTANVFFFSTERKMKETVNNFVRQHIRMHDWVAPVTDHELCVSRQMASEIVPGKQKSPNTLGFRHNNQPPHRNKNTEADNIE